MEPIAADEMVIEYVGQIIRQVKDKLIIRLENDSFVTNLKTC